MLTKIDFFSKFWAKSKLYENFTQIEIFRNFRKKIKFFVNAD